MTRLGYGEEIRRWRAEKFMEIDMLRNAALGRYSTGITVGSKAEGLTCWLESDNDWLLVVNGILCVEAGINIHDILDDIEVYRMDPSVYPGHCRLFLEKPVTVRSNIIHKSLCDDGDGNVLLSSSVLLDECLAFKITHPDVVNHERAGPSLPRTLFGVNHNDRVIALRCHCPSILQRWADRPRHWPPPVIVQKVVSLGTYLTPVGFKESENKHMEWRMCFNTGELELVNNLSDTQAKVYVMLKMILKDVLRPCKKEITSFVLKNIVFWQAETNTQSNCNARSFLYWLHDGLRNLRAAIVTQQLPYYMIPERNLMAASSLHANQQNKWVAEITDMMAEGPRVILKLPKIRQAVIASPEPILWFSKRRLELEMVILEIEKTISQCLCKNGVTDEFVDILKELSIREKEILIEVIYRMLVEGYDVINWKDIYHRILM